MPRLRLLLLLAAALLGLGATAAAAAAALPPRAPEYTVDLDAPAAERWSHVMRDFGGVFNESVAPWIQREMPGPLRAVLEGVFASVDHGLGEFGDEIAGVAAAVGMPVGDITFMNLLYDLTAGCTSVVAQQPNGTVLHARNLDYGIPWLYNLTAQVTFQRGGAEAFRCTTFAGYVGCLTGARAGAFSVTVDERDDGSGQLDNILAALAGGQSIGWFVRSALANRALGFEGAVDKFASTPLVAPVYLIVAGAEAGQGAVVTRNRTAALDVWRLGATPAAAPFYVLETNYDHWKPNPPSDPRREVANRGMRAMGQARLSLEGMFKVLSTHPVLNSGTKYTVLISPALGRYDAFKRPESLADGVPAYPRRLGHE